MLQAGIEAAKSIDADKLRPALETASMTASRAVWRSVLRSSGVQAATS